MGLRLALVALVAALAWLLGRLVVPQVPRLPWAPNRVVNRTADSVPRSGNADEGDDMKRVIFICCVALAGCGTMQGLGNDMQSAGASLSNQADEQRAPVATPYASPAPDYMRAPPPDVLP